MSRLPASSVVVAALASSFGVALLQVVGVLQGVLQADDRTGSSGTVVLLLRICAVVFLVVATYTAAVVTANTFATVIAGRVREIALLRLLGSSARRERRRVALQGLRVGLLGAAIGAVVGTLAALGIERLGVATGQIVESGYGYGDPVILIPVAGVAITTWLAAVVGSRRVTAVTPLEALGRAEEPAPESGRPRRRGLALGLVIAGAVLLGLGLAVGAASPLGVLIALPGGVLSFTGIVLGADAVMPPVLRLTGRLLGTSAAARLAAENAVRHPERSSRATIGLVIGVTLVTMLAVAMAGFEASVRAAQEQSPESYGGTDPALAAVTAVFSVLVGFSAVIAAVGLAATMSLNVAQRRRELGLLRALGFSARQVRAMILGEAAQLTFAAVALGLVLGSVYGWIGAQSLLGFASGLVVPAPPIVALASVVVGGAIVTLAASAAPTRQALRVSPVEALAVD